MIINATYAVYFASSIVYNCTMKKKIVVGFSGGKDSTASAVLLKEQGYDVHALTMKLGLENEDKKIEKIKHLAETMSLPHSTVDFRDIFKEKVIDYFITSYARNLTPNPCVLCNNEIKFHLLMKEALQNLKADFYATGHYAAKTEIDGKFFLTEPEDRNKSQIYFLSMIGNKALERVHFPIAGISIERVRELVKDLPLANKDESQDVCFMQNLKLIEFLKGHLPPQFFQKGAILDVKGKKIGTHKGSVYFTIGQRRGTGFASDRKLYVVRKDVKQNTITLGDEEHLYSREAVILQPFYWREIRVGETFKGKFRYMSSFYDVEITEVTTDYIRCRFKEPVKAITPGQVSAFYENDIIVAAGFIK
ncbi:MAG: tRNA 2-thiouridine(34) synthase MnmA [bacterium]|nr:tRNA 2-thiouridine(34) synthase MnmA [bacterium]